MKALYVLFVAVVFSTSAFAQTVTVGFDDLSKEKQAEILAMWKKNYRVEVPANPPGMVALKAPTPVGQWTYPGDIDSHLEKAHGVSREQLSRLTEDEKIRLHAAKHNAVAAPATVATIQASAGCPGGICPTPQGYAIPAYAPAPSGQGWYPGKVLGRVVGR